MEVSRFNLYAIACTNSTELINYDFSNWRWSLNDRNMSCLKLKVVVHSFKNVSCLLKREIPPTSCVKSLRCAFSFTWLSVYNKCSNHENTRELYKHAKLFNFSLISNFFRRRIVPIFPGMLLSSTNFTQVSSLRFVV